MPASRHRIGEVFHEGQPVETLSFDGIMGGHDAQQHLHNKERRDQPKILRGGAHGWRDHRPVHQIDSRNASLRQQFIAPLVVLFGVVPDDCPNARQEDNDRYDRPHEDAGRGPIAHQRFVRPVAGVRHTIVWPIGGRAPSRPEVKGGKVVRLVSRQKRFAGKRILTTQFQSLFAATFIESAEMLLDLFDRARAVVADRDDAAGGIVCVLAHLRAERGAVQGVLRLPRLVRKAPVCRNDCKKSVRFPVQPICGPVRRQISAVPPDRPLLHPSDRLPDLLARRYVFTGVDDLAGLRTHLLRDRRRLLIDLPPEGEKGAEHDRCADGQYDPQTRDRKRPSKIAHRPILPNIGPGIVLAFGPA